jgi:hypothetical protein
LAHCDNSKTGQNRETEIRPLPLLVDGKNILLRYGGKEHLQRAIE